jgi:sulfite exporter TauE/SafE/plastocyanin
MSKQWKESYSTNDSTIKKLEPHLIFNLGRLISYGFFGAVLGGIGREIRVSQDFAPILIIAVSFIMVALGLQLLGVKAFRKFQITMPKFITRSIADERNFKGKYMPFVLGALTFFLPCGFTLAVQAMALISGSIFQGSFMMMAFALGTMPTLLFIGLSAVKFSSNPKMENTFGKIAAILVIFFALYNFNAQLNVLGYTSLSDIKIGVSDDSGSTVCKTTACDIDKAFGSSGKKNIPEQVNNVSGELPPIVDGKQIVRMDASASGYAPRKLKAKVGIPVRWEITDKGTSGCTNAIIAKDFFDGQISLTPGKTSVKEFTPTEIGIYKFSCWMGMVSGTFEIVE